MPADEPVFDLARCLTRFDVVAVLRVTEVERLPPPMLTTNAKSRVVLPLKGTTQDASIAWMSLGDFWFPQRGSECLCALQATREQAGDARGDTPLVLREWAQAEVVSRVASAPEPLARWARAEIAPVPCAQCEATIAIRNRSGLARDVMRGLVFCPRHVPALHVHIAEVIEGTCGEETPSSGAPPGTRVAVDLGLARRGVFPLAGAPAVSYEIDGQGKRSAAGLLPMPTFTDAAGTPRKRSRRCPQCGGTYGSVRPLGICPSCGKKFLADLPDLLD